MLNKEMSRGYRDEAKFSDEELLMVQPLMKKGWEFDFEAVDDYHHNTFEGYEVKFRSPRMMQFGSLHSANITSQMLEQSETNAAALSITRFFETRLRDWLYPKIQYLLVMHPEKTLADFKAMSIDEILAAYD